MNNDEIKQNDYVDEISIKELIQIIWSYKWLIIIITVFSGIMALTVANVMGKRSEQVETIISLEWNGLIEGTYPDGNRFIYNNMFESYVFGDALEAAGVDDVTTTQFRNTLSIKPILPNSAVQLVQQSIENGEQITYYATDYKLILDLGELPVNEEEAKMLLEYLIEAFKTDFESKYIQKAVVLEYTNIDLSTYDYDETYLIFLNQTELLESVVNNALLTGGDFVSNTLNIGFSDLISRLTLIHDVDLSNINTRVSNYMLTKEIDFLITRYTFQVDQKTLELNKKTDYKTVLTQNILDYTGSETVVIIPGMETDFTFNPYINTLYSELVSTQEEIAILENDISYIEDRINHLELLKISGNGETIIYQNQIELVEQDIEAAKENITDVAEDLNVMLKEYNTYLTRNSVIPLTSPQVVSDVNVMLYTAIGTVLGGMVSLLVVFLRETLKKD